MSFFIKSGPCIITDIQTGHSLCNFRTVWRRWFHIRYFSLQCCQRHCNDASAGRSKNTSMMLARGPPMRGRFDQYQTWLR